MIDNFTLIIGSKKCGTTSLYNYLIQHPQISACRVKEPKFFCNNKKWERGFQWYQDLWDFDSNVHRTALEASQSYTYRQSNSSMVADRILDISSKYKSRFKFIYLMRNPIEKIESTRAHGYAEGWLKKSDKSIVSDDLIDACAYAKQLDYYYSRFDHNDIYLLQLEQLKQDTENVIQGINKFLELDEFHRYQELYKVHNPKNFYKTDTIWRQLTKVKPLQPLAKRIPEKYKIQARKFLSHSPKDIADTIPPLTELQKKHILNALHHDLQRLHSDYGVDISRWGLKKQQTDKCSMSLVG